MYTLRLMTIMSSLLFSGYSWALDLTVNIQQVKSAEGYVMVALYDNARDFPSKKRTAGLKLEATQGTVTGTFTGLEAGKYAVATYHDANGNGRLDRNVLGMPKEDYGFSNNVKVSFAPPEFDDAAFELNANKSINIKLR